MEIVKVNEVLEAIDDIRRKKELESSIAYGHGFYAGIAKVEKLIKEKAREEKCAVMCYDEEIPKFEKIPLLPVGPREDIKEQTRRLFDLLRRADELGVDTVYAHIPQKSGDSLAIYNRMIRACAFKVIGGKNG